MTTSRTSSLNLGLSSLPETKGEDFPEFVRIYNALNIMASALDAYTGTTIPDESEWTELDPADTLRSQNLSRLFIQFYENIVAGAPIKIFNDGGVAKAALALGSGFANYADGFSGTSTAAGDWGYVYLGMGLNPYITGLTVGTVYYLSATVAGTITAVRPANPQSVGRALTSSLLWWNTAPI